MYYVKRAIYIIQVKSECVFGEHMTKFEHFNELKT